MGGPRGRGRGIKKSGATQRPGARCEHLPTAGLLYASTLGMSTGHTLEQFRVCFLIRSDCVEEKWARISDSDGEYVISNFGRVMNIATGKVLRPRKTPTGYERVHLPSENKRKDFYIHRLVAEHFCIHPFNHDVVNHLDNNPSNNISTNLEWTTQRGNVLYAMEQHRVKKFPNMRAVVCVTEENEIVFRSAHEAAEKTGCDHSAILKCCKGKAKTTHGLMWKYAEVTA